MRYVPLEPARPQAAAARRAGRGEGRARPPPGSLRARPLRLGDRKDAGSGGRQRVALGAGTEPPAVCPRDPRCTKGGDWGPEARQGGVSGSEEGLLETWHSEPGWFRRGRRAAASLGAGSQSPTPPGPRAQGSGSPCREAAGGSGPVRPPGRPAAATRQCGRAPPPRPRSQSAPAAGLFKKRRAGVAMSAGRSLRHVNTHPKGRGRRLPEPSRPQVPRTASAAAPRNVTTAASPGSRRIAALRTPAGNAGRLWHGGPTRSCRGVRLALGTTVNSQSQFLRVYNFFSKLRSPGLEDARVQCEIALTRPQQGTGRKINYSKTLRSRPPLSEEDRLSS